MHTRVLLATRNQGKRREYQNLLAGLNLALVTLDEAGIDLEVEETGATFAENALLKARGYAHASGLPTLADDSGLEVDALGGAPGVHSARYAGADATDQDRCLLLLQSLHNIPEGQRGARFRCVIAVAWPDGAIDVADGTCEGSIAHAPRGSHGFGYDPVFLPAGRTVTMAELSPEEKDRISHRARAAAALRPALERRLAGQGQRPPLT
ncbi:MAG: XTP/dITP diphosphatase [Chloroflexi bacterium]|nr:XTP/dITP diphosphatase [Chloroflexota bacterium]